MLYDLHNPTRAPRTFYDGAISAPIRLAPGQKRLNVVLLDATAEKMRGSDIAIKISAQQRPDMPAMVINGMWGIGDCLHQRGPLRELMKVKRVWLTTCNWHINSDLVDQGLNLIFDGNTRLRGQQLSISRERALFQTMEPPPRDAWRIKLWYRKDGIDQYGSILETMYANCFIEPPPRMDFSWPIRPEWRDKAREMIASWKLDGRPLLVYRPIVLRREWKSANRNPEPKPYAELFEHARRGYFVVSFAYLDAGDEEIVGAEAKVDLKFHRGEIPVEIIAAIVAEANLVFCNAGFMPVMAQAVGTPTIVVYGGRESFRTTQRAGAHLAPTLGVDIDRPCDCHSERHACDRTLTASRWIDKVTDFSEKYAAARIGADALTVETAATSDDRPLVAHPRIRTQASTLIFATTYVDGPERQELTAQWLEMADVLNPDCDILIVDSKSPLSPLTGVWVERFANDLRFRMFAFGNNIGHLSRKGRDGWGRAFCKGLESAIAGGYQYVVHIEGDSLLRVPVREMIDPMREARKFAATTRVSGMTRDFPNWVETGLMAFDTDWLIRANFISRYDWVNRGQTPTPEVVVARLISGSELILPLKAWRGDKQQITHENIVSLGLDWVTHCHTSANGVWAYREFMKAAMSTFTAMGTAIGAAGPEHTSVNVSPPSRPDPPRTVAIIEPGLKINLGCGTNKLAGWENHDDEVDITKPLPWAEGAADFIFIEHCVEHVSFHQAIGFFEEAFRVLRPGGVLRVTVPSIEKIALTSTPDYWKFAAKWGGEATWKGAMRAILFAHGHQMGWTASAMRYSLAYAGFVDIEAREVGESPHAALRGAEGHGVVIGRAFNEIESMPFDATKPGGEGRKHGPIPLAIVLGGADCVLDDLASARADCDRYGLTPSYFVVNDMIPEFPDPCVAVTVHANNPLKLPVWLAKRARNGFPTPRSIWTHQKDPASTNVAEDWHGSSGLHAFVVARRMGFERVVFCGVPMNPDGGHFKRHDTFIAAGAFRKAWEKRVRLIQPFARSYSGWTAELLGAPDEGFFR